MFLFARRLQKYKERKEEPRKKGKEKINSEFWKTPFASAAFAFDLLVIRRVAICEAHETSWMTYGHIEESFILAHTLMLSFRPENSLIPFYCIQLIP